MTRQTMHIAGRKVGEGQPVFIIAEIGVNHNGSIALAKKLIDLSVKAGADAVKLQMCDPDEMVTKVAPKAEYQKKKVKGESHHEMLARLFFDVKEHKELQAYAKKKGIILFSTPFSIKDAKKLIALKMPAMKVGSSDTNNIPQLRVLACAGVPIILSTGMSDLAEVRQSIKEIVKAGNSQIIVLQCTTQYPAEDANTNLRAMDTMREAFKVPVGYSDHTRGSDIPLAAVARGACVIEKHITLDRTMPGPDHFASMEPEEFKNLVKGIRRIEVALGSGKKTSSADEKIIAKVARKSIVAAHDLEKGVRITENDLAYKRPGTGLVPGMADKVIGKRTRRALKKDQLLTLADFS